MKLRRLTIRRMPGIDDVIALDGLVEGVNLIVGPNGSGKTALCRAFHASVWPALEPGRGLATEAEWMLGAERWTVRRDGDRLVWQRDGVPVDAPELPDVHAARCFSLEFRDLLLEEAATDETVALEIRRQISGGFDLDRLLAETLGLRPRHGLAEDNRLRERSRDLELVRRAQIELGERETQSIDLDRRIVEARVAAARGEPLRAAIELRDVRDGIVTLERAVAELPTGLDRLRGDEAETLAELDDERERLTGKRVECDRQIARLESERERLTPPAGLPDETRIKSWIHRARALHQLEHEIRQTERVLTEAGEARRAAEASLEPDRSSERPPVVEEQAVAEIEAFVERAARVRSRTEQVEDEIELLGPVAADTDERAWDPAIETLEAWLAASAAGRSTRSLVVAVVALVPLAAAAWLWWSGGDPSITAAAATAAVVLWVVAVGAAWTDPARRAMREARRRYDALEAEPPSGWQPQPVRTRLDELRRTRSDAAHAARLDRRREELTARLTALAEQQDAIERERRALRERFGVDPGSGGQAPLRILQRVETFRQADRRYRDARTAREQAGRQHAETLEAIDAFVTDACLEPVSDAASALAAIEDLRERARRLQQIGDQLAGLALRRDEVEQRLAELTDKRDGFFRSLGLEPGDDGGLRDRLERLPRHHALVEQLRSERTRADDLARRAGEYADAEAFDGTRLRELVVEAEQAADDVVALAKELGEIQKAVSDARAGQLLEDALAGVDEAREALESCRDEALFKTAGRFLVERVSEEFDRSSRPEILARAIDLFGRFTHHRYELKVDLSQAAPRFRAVEAETGLGKALAELSAATRVQLLLAARLAYVHHVDPSAGLPLLLDEVLATSDPERFVAIADSLLMLAREERRQILYFTSDPADVLRWQRLFAGAGLAAPALFDLAAIRGQTAGITERSELDVPPLPRVPSPDGHDADRYGALLGVPRVDPSRSVNALHLFHLLREDLAGLHELLTARIRTVGQWRRLVASGDATLLLGNEPARRLSALADTAEAFFDAWRVGRGRPIDTTVLEEAGLSESWIVRLESLVDELDGDASMLVAALTERADERTKGFQTRVRRRLVDHLIAGGFLDERDALDGPQIHARVRAAVAVHVDAGRLDAEQVATLVHRLFHQTGSSAEHDGGAVRESGVVAPLDGGEGRGADEVSRGL